MDKHIPTKKAPKIENFLTKIMGTSRPDAIRGGRCVFCQEENLTRNSFSNALSYKEYCISGICEKCQDETFGK